MTEIQNLQMTLKNRIGICVLYFKNAMNISTLIYYSNLARNHRTI